MPPDPTDPAARRLLDAWFGDTRERVEAIAGRMGFWFSPNAARDADLGERFATTCGRALAGDLDGWARTPRGRLALVLALDQLPRNLQRGTAAAFAGDDRALALCLEGHAAGVERRLARIERVFFWMPLQHAEDVALQDLGVRLYDTLAANDRDHAELWEGFAAYARRHRDIIRRFGRFPHRNGALGRATTADEARWLEETGERFGQ